MKKISLIILPVLLIFGCSKSVNISNLNTKDGLVYLPHSSDTFSGNFYENDVSGNKKIEGIYENGILRNRTEYGKSGYNLFSFYFSFCLFYKNCFFKFFSLVSVKIYKFFSSRNKNKFISKIYAPRLYFPLEKKFCKTHSKYN